MFAGRVRSERALLFSVLCRLSSTPMKIHFLFLPLLSMAPVAALAQSQAAPQIKTEPAVNVLLDRATATYKAASGIRYRALNTFNGKSLNTTDVAFSRPNLLSIEIQYGKTTRRKLYDGANFYSVSDGTYRKDVSPSATALPLLSVMGYGETSGQLIGAMLDGKNPIEFLQNIYSGGPVKNYNASTIVLAPRVVDGDVLSGIQHTYSYSFEMPESGGKMEKVSEQLTAWFGGTPLVLRRVQLRGTHSDGKIYTRSEKIIDQGLSPTFEASAFKWNDAGLKLAAQEQEIDSEIYWDKRLKVGTRPFAFSAKTLDGKIVSPAKYKGKVLLIDFWATWCGPCVAGLPEIQAAYKKYHSKGFEVVGISSDQNKSELTSFIKARKMAWPQVFDTDQKNSVSKLYGVTGIPFLLLIGRDGKISALDPHGDLDGAVKKALAAK